MNAMNNVALLNLSEVADAINSATERAAALYVSSIGILKEGLLCDKEAGDLLIQVKAQLPHGQFIPWIEANCKFTRQHANHLMLIARNWTKILVAWEEMNCNTRVPSGSPLLSLRQAIAIAATQPKEETESVESPTQYRVATPNHPSYGSVVTVKREMHGGDMVVCETPTGDYPFLKKELVAPNEPLQAQAEIIDVEIIDESEKLREAIAILIEYFPDSVLKALLSQALFMGRGYLPESAKSSASSLLAGSEMGTLTLT